MVFRILLAASALMVAGCSRAPDDQRIRGNIESTRLAIEAHDPARFLRFISTDFSGNEGSVDREAFSNLLRIQVLRDDRVGVTLGAIDINLDGDRATVRLMSTFTDGQGGTIPDHVAVYWITSGWRRESRNWICYAAQWKEKL